METNDQPLEYPRLLQTAKRCAIFFVSVGIFFASCQKKPELALPANPLFILKASENSLFLDADVHFHSYASGVRIARIPFDCRAERFMLSVNLPTDARLMMHGAEFDEGTLALAVNEATEIVVIMSDGAATPYRIHLVPDTGLPVCWIETEDGKPVTSKEDYKDAMMTIDPGTGYEQQQREISLGIRGRGNSTWGMPKKPYRLRFNQKTEFLGFPATRNWVLLANYADKTLLRNYVAFELGRQMMSGFTPRNAFVEVYVNGEYQGLYHLTDQIRVEEVRVDIDELEETNEDPALITGGYLLEIDERLDEEHWFMSDVLDFPITFKSPEVPNAAQRDYITTYIREFEEIISSPDIASRGAEYEHYIDVPSFIDYYLISEIMKNNDTGIGTSIYLTKPRNGKLSMGPLWDFDIAAGNINYHGNEYPEGWWIRPINRWYAHLFRDKRFEDAVKSRWETIRPTVLADIMEQIDATAFGTLAKAQQHNFERWPILNEWVWPNAVVLGTYEAEVEYLKTWLADRIAWMDAEIKQW